MLSNAKFKVTVGCRHPVPNIHLFIKYIIRYQISPILFITFVDSKNPQAFSVLARDSQPNNRFIFCSVRFQWNSNLRCLEYLNSPKFVNLIIFDVEDMFRWLVLLLSKCKLFLIHIICYSSVLVVLEFSIPKYEIRHSVCAFPVIFSFPLITSTNNFRLQYTNADKGERRRTGRKCLFRPLLFEFPSHGELFFWY